MVVDFKSLCFEPNFTVIFTTAPASFDLVETVEFWEIGRDRYNRPVRQVGASPSSIITQARQYIEGDYHIFDCFTLREAIDCSFVTLTPIRDRDRSRTIRRK